jgi:hypothetical protein
VRDVYRRSTDVLKVLQQVCNSLALAVGEDWLIQAITGFA